MKFAIIKTGGKQYKVREGETYKFEKLEGDSSKLVFDEVLLVAEDTDQDAPNVRLGEPLVAKAKVEAERVANGLGEKLRVFKYKAKSRYRVKQGHRQPYTEVKITKIG